MRKYPNQLFDEAANILANLDPGLFTTNMEAIAYAQALTTLGYAELEFERGARPIRRSADGIF